MKLKCLYRLARLALLDSSIYRALAAHNIAEVVAINAKQKPVTFDRRPENEEAKSEVARKLSVMPDQGWPGGHDCAWIPFV
jgi:hypothetical protein